MSPVYLYHNYLSIITHMTNPLADKLQKIADQATKNCLMIRWEYTRETNPKKQTKLLILFSQFQSRIAHVQEMIYRLEFSNSWYEKVTEQKRITPIFSYSDTTKKIINQAKTVVDQLMDRSRQQLSFIS